MQRLGIVFAVPLGGEGIVLEAKHVAVGRGAAGQPVEAARLAEGVALVPAADFEAIGAQVIGQARDVAGAVDAIFGRPVGQRGGGGDGLAGIVGCAGRGGEIGGDPGALALVVVVVAGGGEGEGGGEAHVEGEAAQPVAAKTRGVEIDVVDGADAGGEGETDTGEGQCGGGVGGAGVLVVEHLRDADRQRIVVADIVVPQAAACDDAEAEILIVDLAPVGKVDKAGDAAEPVHLLDQLGIRLMLALAAKALPLVGGQVAIGQIALEPAAQIAAIGADEGTNGVVAAIGAGGDQIGGVGGRAAFELQRAAQIAGRGGAERARTLRNGGAADIFGNNRAADMQAVDVAIAHVAERHAVERKAELVLVEAAQRDARRPFIGAKGVGGLEIDAGQLGGGL